MKLLLTSVGSLVGQNILDVLEHPGSSRRSQVRVIGTNSVADAVCNFRCDRCYLVPLTLASGYLERMRDILQTESPDLILCCRDEDTYILSQLKSEHPELPGVLPLANPQAALIGLDKWQTWLFARKHGLPFAESFMPGESGDAAALETFCQRVGYPLIAKPARGFGSRGVCFIRDAGDAQTMAQRPDYLVQEFVGEPQCLEPYFKSLQGPPPLFAQFEDASHRSGHTIIDRNGALAPVSLTESKTVRGPRPNWRISDPELVALTLNYAGSLFLEGGTGPITVQYRRDRLGAWKAIEMNLRTTGGTAARFLRGIDELYLISKAFVPGTSFPERRPLSADEPCQIIRLYGSYPIAESIVATLRQSGVWSRS
jgi:carbamoyl-phosphate synthase large subunit